MEITNKNTYNYFLPEQLIAQSPIEPRDTSKLLVYDLKSKQIEHKNFYNITNYLKKGDVLVINNTRVLPARLFGKKEKTGARIEILLHKRLNLKTWEIVAKPIKRLKIGTVIFFCDDLKGIIEKIGEYGECIIRFDFIKSFEEIINKIGLMPLPHYIKTKLKDKERYQTIYSKTEGSSAAPTAGLHFTKELLKKIQDIGVIISEVTLHVGLGTFRPVSDDDILKHKMHSEYYEISPETADIINNAKNNGNRIIAVGTTSVRVLESSFNFNGEVKAGSGYTDIFIYPGYKFKIVKGIITNFHLPMSTLIMLVCAFTGISETLKLYEIAVKEKYRFYSFGDACLFI